MSEAVYDWLAYFAEFDPDRLAAVDLHTGRNLGYGELDARATRLATGLRESCGVRGGDRVAFLAQNSTDHFETMFACWKIGAVFVPLNWRLAPREIAAILAGCTPRVVFHDPEFEPLVSSTPVLALERRQGERGCAYEALIAAHAPTARMAGVTHDTINGLMYTSGTTGRPKGVIYTHRMSHNIVVHAAVHARLRERTRTLTYSPLFHVAGLNGLTMSQFHYGGAVVVMRQFDPRECLRLLTDRAAGITHTVGVPTTFQMMSELPEFATATFPTLEVAGVGAAPVPRHLLEVWERRGVLLGQSYGTTEAFSVAFCPPERTREKLGSAGHAMMHIEVQVGDAAGRVRPRGEVGEIQVRGPGVTPGYWNDPGATAAAFTANRWFHTGDAARMTDDGTLYIVDRIKDMYISGGENVYPAEVEDVIDSLDEVRQCAVIGVPDAKWGEVGLALVVLRAGAVFDVERILARCREQLARYKVPRRVEVVEGLPCSPQGKVLKHALRRHYAQEVL